MEVGALLDEEVVVGDGEGERGEGEEAEEGVPELPLVDGPDGRVGAEEGEEELEARGEGEGVGEEERLGGGEGRDDGHGAAWN